MLSRGKTIGGRMSTRDLFTRKTVHKCECAVILRAEMSALLFLTRLNSRRDEFVGFVLLFY